MALFFNQLHIPGGIVVVVVVLKCDNLRNYCSLLNIPETSYYKKKKLSTDGGKKHTK